MTVVSPKFYPADAAFIDPLADLSSGAPNAIYVMNPDGTDLAKLADTPDLDEQRRAWSPDDSKLVFALRSDSKSVGGIHCINADGTGLKKLATGASTMGVDWAK